MVRIIKHGYSNGAVAHNIASAQRMGAPHNQAVAMALRIRDAQLRRKDMRENQDGMATMPQWRRGDRRILY